MAGHTPGPWVVDREFYGQGRTARIADAKGRTVARLTTEHIGGRLVDRNADLIAAAPLLLDGARDTVEALKLLHVGLTNGVIDEPKMLEVIEAHIDELLCAITKATGAA